MKTRILTSTVVLTALLLAACSADAQIPPNSVELKQRNADGDGWAAPRIIPQPDSVLTFDTAQQPTTALISTFAKASDLSILNSTVGTLQTQVTTNTGKLVSVETSITALQTSVAGKEAAGVAASLLSAHTAAANPHTQYALASALNDTTVTLTTSLAAKQDASSALAKITEGGDLPLWNGAAWPGGSVGGGSYTLPPATATTLGGIKVGINLSITADGTLSAVAGFPIVGENVSIKENEWKLLLYAYDSVDLHAGNTIDLRTTGGGMNFNAEEGVNFTINYPEEDAGFFSFNREIKGVDGTTPNALVTKRQLDAAVAASSGQTIVTIPRIGNTFTLDANADVCIINQPESDYEYMQVVIPSNRKVGALVLIINNVEGVDTGVYHFQSIASDGYRGNIQNSGYALASGDAEFSLGVKYGARLDFFWHGGIMSVTGCVFQ